MIKNNSSETFLVTFTIQVLSAMFCPDLISEGAETLCVFGRNDLTQGSGCLLKASAHGSNQLMIELLSHKLHSLAMLIRTADCIDLSHSFAPKRDIPLARPPLESALNEVVTLCQPDSQSSSQTSPLLPCIGRQPSRTFCLQLLSFLPHLLQN